MAVFERRNRKPKTLFLLYTRNGENSERNIIVKREKSLLYKAFLRKRCFKNNLQGILEADGSKRRDLIFKHKYRTIRTHEKRAKNRALKRNFGENQERKRAKNALWREQKENKKPL